MRFNYPHKLYLFGLSFFLIASIYGFMMIYDASREFILMKFAYGLIVMFISYWYFEKYQYYKNMYVIVNKKEIHIFSKNRHDVIPSDEIDCIINSNHRQALKVHNVTHLFTYDGRYYYFTNELNGYEKFKKILKEYFQSHYIQINKAITNYPKITKENLLSYKDN